MLCRETRNKQIKVMNLTNRTTDISSAQGGNQAAGLDRRPRRRAVESGSHTSKQQQRIRQTPLQTRSQLAKRLFLNNAAVAPSLPHSLVGKYPEYRASTARLRIDTVLSSRLQPSKPEPQLAFERR